MKIRTSTVALAAFAIAVTGLPAVARSVSTIAEPNHGPVQIAACRAAYDSGQLVVSVDFKNTGDKIATSVAFSFTAEDAFGQTLRYLLGVRKGEAAPGAEIDNWQGASVALSGPIASDLSDVACSVQTIHFKDGSEWNAGAADAAPGYPSTPNPDGTPAPLSLR
jgi:hypothetical protein